MKRFALVTTLIASAIGATLAFADPTTPTVGSGPCGMGGGGYGYGAGCGAGPGPGAGPGAGGCGMGPGAEGGQGPGAGCGMGPGRGHGPGRMRGAGPGPGGGDPLLTPQERADHMTKMQALKSVDECNAYMAEFRKLLEARAKERGVAAPGPGPRGDACERMQAHGRFG